MSSRITSRQKTTRRSHRIVVGTVLLFSGLFVLESVEAQRPFRSYESFYRSETARRQFFDRYALSGEVAYRPSGSIQNDALATPTVDPFGFSFRFDYQLAQTFDLGLVVDAAGGFGGRSMSISWVTVQYYKTVESSDYAFRLAVDPASDGRAGFPQVDVAFLYTEVLSPELTSDYAIGIRRVRIGYEQLVELEPSAELVSNAPEFGIAFTRALGWELNAMIQYNALFDPAGSSVFFSMLGQASSYELIDVAFEDLDADPEIDDGTSTDVEVSRGGIIWLRSGMKFARPSYEFSPFLGLPIQQWTPRNDNWPTSRLQVGVRLMIR
ncbi:MAG: hypothetical protein HKN43_06680 [Rhodothermales bacterium]|nr:hypothetical protein [Rhodothermales bacterium]